MIVVTGGAGFIGANFVRALNKNNIKDIIIVDNLESNILKKKNLNHLKFSKYYDKYSFINLIKNAKINPDINFFFHLGACSSTTNFDKQYLKKNNYEYSKILFNWCNDNKIPFIYASSASVYGDTLIEAKETDLMNPLNPYAESKKMFDQFVLKNLNKSNTPIIGLRYFNVYGPYEAHKQNMTSPIYKFYQQLITSNKVNIFDSYNGFNRGEHSRDFIHVDDCVKIKLWFMNNLKSGIYNIGTGKSITFLDIAKKILQRRNNIGTINFINFPEILKNSYQCFTKANNLKLTKAGYNKKFINIDEGINSYINFLDKTN